MAYQLCDGFAVSNGYFVIYPNLGGTFKGLKDDPAVGMYFVPTDGSPEVKVTRFNENSPSSIRGIIPNCDADHCKIEIRTQFSGTIAKQLKNIRVITSNFTLERA